MPPNKHTYGTGSKLFKQAKDQISKTMGIAGRNKKPR